MIGYVLDDERIRVRCVVEGGIFSSHNSYHIDPETHVSSTQRPLWLFPRAQSDQIVTLNFHLHQSH